MTSHIGMSKVPMSNRLDVDNINELSELAGADNLSKGGVVRRVSQD